MAAAPSSPAVLPPSGSSPPPPTPISLPDTPASADPETPFSDAATASDADASAVAAVAVDGAPGDGEDDGITNPTAGDAGKHITLAPPAPPSKKSKKKGGNSVWTRPTSRKGKKKAKQPGNGAGGTSGANGGRPRPSADEDEFLLTPAPRLAADRNDDALDLPVLLSRVYKSDKIEVSEDRLTAGGTKGFRMVRATRGVATGAWYFEIKVVHLGPSGHTRLGWATNMADLHTPVGCDKYGFAFRDVDGAKVTKAWRDDYATEGYVEGDVLGFYISLPEGELYAPKQPQLVNYKGMPFHAQSAKDESKTPDPVPGSEICYFKNGVCQGTAFVDIPGGRYYPAASMYTLPDEPNCEVRFNFGPDFVFLPEDFGGRPVPRPMSEVPYQAYELRKEGPAENEVPRSDNDEANGSSESEANISSESEEDDSSASEENVSYENEEDGSSESEEDGSSESEEDGSCESEENGSSECEENGSSESEANGSDNDTSLDSEVKKKILAHEQLVRRTNRLTPSQLRLFELICLVKSRYRRRNIHPK